MKKTDKKKNKPKNDKTANEDNKSTKMESNERIIKSAKDRSSNGTQERTG